MRRVTAAVTVLAFASSVACGTSVETADEPSPTLGAPTTVAVTPVHPSTALEAAQLIRDAGFGCKPYREKGNALALGAKNTAECRVGLPGSTETSFMASIDTYAQPDQIVPGISYGRSVGLNFNGLIVCSPTTIFVDDTTTAAALGAALGCEVLDS